MPVDPTLLIGALITLSVVQDDSGIDSTSSRQHIVRTRAKPPMRLSRELGGFDYNIYIMMAWTILSFFGDTYEFTGIIVIDIKALTKLHKVLSSGYHYATINTLRVRSYIPGTNILLATATYRHAGAKGTATTA